MLDNNYDLIVCSSLLHEVEQPKKLINAITQICNDGTVVHINVPNANSMHRLLGVSMGLIHEVHDKTENNILMQQNVVFDKHSLRQIVEDNGLHVIEEGGIFIKPFSHSQMQSIYEKGIIDERVLDGLYDLAKYMPEYASEIYVNSTL